MSIAGFFADGIDYNLPHPALDDSVLLIAHNAIAQAFCMLRVAPPAGFELSSAPENAITQQLEWILENHLRKTGKVAGFDERIFQKVRRGAEVTNFDGKHPSKKPDLVFDLARDAPLALSSLDALFVECKPVDKAHPLEKHYGSMGVFRFVNGDYSWAMQEGMMVGYVRDGKTLSASLAPVFSQEPLHSLLGKPTVMTLVAHGACSCMAEWLHVTTHLRNFQWPQNKGGASPIRLFHSWHRCL
ncbi:hypothetical protein RFM68_24965 [Mesorhizobium sp. MSK_1335]|uniref:Uncharacterized protein n=1 Tax=Mesorhizobium montanum TaxID=3072323 RepID=A0ABU4ZUZ7_9HYPH|nr:hypothetical protein [Mesorhizobium sp. MSK_1335]MDX8527756.1 hypothetical protein [Mesorhizobium sp. MSK_1335]